MKLIHFEHDGAPLTRSDAPWLGSATLVLRAAAVVALRSLLEANGELLPVDCDEARLFLFHATRVLDVLDEERSEILRFRTSGRVMDVTRYVFRASDLRGVDCFKIPQFRVSPTFVSERFVDAWHAAGLRGLEFEPIWSDE